MYDKQTVRMWWNSCIHDEFFLPWVVSILWPLVPHLQHLGSLSWPSCRNLIMIFRQTCLLGLAWPFPWTGLLWFRSLQTDCSSITIHRCVPLFALPLQHYLETARTADCWSSGSNALSENLNSDMLDVWPAIHSLNKSGYDSISKVSTKHAVLKLGSSSGPELLKDVCKTALTKGILADSEHFLVCAVSGDDTFETVDELRTINTAIRRFQTILSDWHRRLQASDSIFRGRTSNATNG